MARTNQEGKSPQISPTNTPSSRKPHTSSPPQDKSPTESKKQAAEPSPPSKVKPPSPPISQSTKNNLPSQETIPTPKRVNRGYRLREDLVKSCKRIALEEDRWLYEVLDEAIEFYLHMRRAPQGIKQPR